MGANKSKANTLDVTPYLLFLVRPLCSIVFSKSVKLFSSLLDKYNPNIIHTTTETAMNNKVFLLSPPETLTAVSKPTIPKGTKPSRKTAVDFLNLSRAFKPACSDSVAYF